MTVGRIIGLTLGCALLALLTLHGQGSVAPREKRPPPGQGSKPAATLRSDINLVLVPVSVCDPMNRPVTGLEKEHFKVFDDKVEQTVTQFAMEDEPLAVGLVF